jgi:sugar O-acyltransferase (sialic acid O-acetyltransferase NeuD family)
MKNLLIIGARGFGREIYNSAMESIGYNKDFIIKGFLDDKLDVLDGYKDYPAIIDSVENYSIQIDDIFICALGEVKYKKYYSEIIIRKGGNFTTIIHKDAYLSKNTIIGKGCIILAGARVHCDVKIGNFVTLQPYAIIGHDVIIEDWSHINALADCGGFSRIGKGVTLHTTCFVLPKVIVEDNATVGAGSVVLNNVKAGTTVFGIPAKPILVPSKIM